MVGEPVIAMVDVERRRATSRAHTATHMVHKAFREILGPNANQAGSENGPGRSRFDFSASGRVPQSTLAEVEQRVNSILADDLPVAAEIMGIDQALSTGAIGLFEDKYGDQVPGRIGGRLVEGVVRRHPCGAVIPAGIGQTNGRRIDRCGRTESRGACRTRCLQLLVAGTSDRQPTRGNP